MRDEPLLLSAARQDSFKLLCQLLDAGEDPNQTNNAGETALILAVQRGFEKAVFRLLEAGADALKAGGDITTGARTSALYFSLKDGNQTIIKMLLDSIDLNAYDKICWYRSLAGSNGYTSFSDDALLKVENISCQPTAVESLSPLFQAIYKDDFKSFKKLLASGADPHETVLPNTSNGLLALHTAIRLHRDAMFDLLIEKDVDINQRNSPYNYSPLFVAVYSKNKYAYRRLMDLEAEDLPTANHHTALFAAVYTNDMTAVQELVECGSDLNQYAQWGYCTLVYAAARYGHVDVLRYLLSLGLHPDWDAEGKSYYYEQFYGLQQTALTAAVKNGDREAVELLLKAGADPNRKLNGIPPLHFAIPSYRLTESETIDYESHVKRSIAIIDLLLAHGAVIDLKSDHNHITALVQAIVSGQEEIAIHLIKSGAATDQKDKRGKLPLDYAKTFNQNLLVSFA